MRVRSIPSSAKQSILLHFKVIEYYEVPGNISFCGIVQSSKCDTIFCNIWIVVVLDTIFIQQMKQQNITDPNLGFTSRKIIPIYRQYRQGKKFMQLITLLVPYTPEGSLQCILA